MPWIQTASHTADASVREGKVNNPKDNPVQKGVASTAVTEKYFAAEFAEMKGSHRI